MAEDGRVELKISVGEQEIEIKGSMEEVKELLDYCNDYIRQLSTYVESDSTGDGISKKGATEALEVPPDIRIEKEDSAASIIEKILSSGWANKPKTLREFHSVLKELGVHYPKSTVAVTLKRLVKRNVARRMKSEDDVYVYVPASPSPPQE